MSTASMSASFVPQLVWCYPTSKVLTAIPLTLCSSQYYASSIYEDDISSVESQRCISANVPQLVKYDVHTTRKINSIHAIFYHILFLLLIYFNWNYFVMRSNTIRRA